VYTPVRSDKRTAGARTRSYASKYSREKSSATTRNVTPGYTDLKTLTRMDGLTTGIYEDDQSIYSLEEQNQEKQIFDVNKSVRNLIEVLDKKEFLNTEQKDEAQ
jgi:hypothetical protein